MLFNKNRYPEPHEVVFCHAHTEWEELHLLLLRCSLFLLIFPFLFFFFLIFFFFIFYKKELYFNEKKISRAPRSSILPRTHRMGRIAPSFASLFLRARAGTHGSCSIILHCQRWISFIYLFIFLIFNFCIFFFLNFIIIIF